MNRRRIGFFGGSFDPPHSGHREAALAFLRSGQIDELWVVPALQAPLKHRVPVAFEIRLELCRLNFETIDRLSVCDVERNLPVPSYTFTTLDVLSRENPEDEWVLCVGIDSFIGMSGWYKATELMKRFKILVVERPGFEKKDLKTLPNSGTVSFVPIELNPAASTVIRAQLETDSNPDGLLPKVAAFISERGLYR